MKLLEKHVNSLIPGAKFQIYKYKKHTDTFEGTVVAFPGSIGMFCKLKETQKYQVDERSHWYPLIYEGNFVGIVTFSISWSKRTIKILESLLGLISKNVYLILNYELQDITLMNIFEVLGDMVDARDFITSGHSERVADYCDLVCDIMEIKNSRRNLIRVSALLHDIGKIGVPENILFKTGPLNEDEFNIVKTHTVVGYNILSKINFGSKYEKLPSIVRGHHEKIDGSGYPDGLVGEEIPWESRLIGVCDVFDALTNQRQYREEMSFDEAKTIIQGDNRFFDKNILDVFLKIKNSKLEEVYKKHRI